MSSPIAEKFSLSSPGVRRWSWPWQATQSLWWGPSGLWQADASPAGATRWQDLAAWCAAHPGQRATLWLSAWWVVDMVVDAALPLPDDAALLAYVRPLLQHYHGDAAAPWPLAAWQAGGARGVSALHGLELPEVLATAQQHGVRLAALQPWWARALRLALTRQPALAREPAAQLVVVEGRLVTRLDLRRGHVVGLQQRRLAQASPAALQAWMDDEPVAVQCCLGYGLGAERPSTQNVRTAGDAGRLQPITLGRLDGEAPQAAWWAGSPSAVALPAGPRALSMPAAGTPHRAAA